MIKPVLVEICSPGSFLTVFLVVHKMQLVKDFLGVFFEVNFISYTKNRKDEPE